jgi:type I restriction enzyme S subunit
MEDRLNELPKGWIWTTLEGIASNDKNAIVDGPFGSNLKLSDYIGDENGVPVLTTKNLEYGYGRNFVRYISKDKFQELKRSEVKGGDILVAKIGSCGKVAIYPENLQSAMIPANLLKMTVHPEIKKLYVFHFISSPFFKKELESITTATAQPAFNVTKFRKLLIPLPPLPEQHRIVAKIEELFTRLDAGVEALKKVKGQIKRYQQAVLKYAFEGKLTQQWRENVGTYGNTPIEPASALLERIKEQRKKEAKGKIKELPPVDTSELPELPEGWVWTRVGDVSKMIQYGTSEKANDDPNGIPVIRMGNILDGKIVYDNLKYFPKEWPQLRDFILQDGDVLFNRTNSMELVGKTAVYKKYPPKAVFASYLIRIKLIEDSYRPELLSFFINSLYGRRYIASVVSQQVGQANVNGTKLSLMPIPLIPLPEQKKIVEEIETRLSIADNIEKIVEQSLKQSERLRQSILKRAFEGKLVPQDPTDEPASVLLERIKSNRQPKTIKVKYQKEKGLWQKSRTNG